MKSAVVSGCKQGDLLVNTASETGANSVPLSYARGVTVIHETNRWSHLAN